MDHGIQNKTCIPKNETYTDHSLNIIHMALLKKTHSLFFIFLPLLLTGCYQDFDPKIDIKPVLCLNSLITAGEPINVRVSRTWVYTDESGEKDHSVSDATVSIYINGSLVDSGYIPAEGDRIRIHASSPNYGEAEAEVTVPVATEICGFECNTKVTDLSATQTPGLGMNANLQFDINITLDLKDSKDTDDYHRLAYCIFNPEDDGTWEDDQEYPTRSSNYGYLSEGYFEALDPVFYQQVDPFEDMMNGSYHTLFFSDILYNGEEKPLTFGFSSNIFRLSGWDGDLADLECGWDLTLYSISESYYNWLAYDLQDESFVFGDLTDMGLAEPIWGYSNVSTGAGVVAAQSSTTVTIDLRDFLQETLKEAERQ